ncbi:hypothetical protein Q3G72_020118 [Acer saccharum]|nr:hypothetical protein Q3G72_020118 [Acer saccharum]
MNWCCKNKPKKLDNEFTDEMEAIPTLAPTADELQQDYMVYFNPENAMEDIPETSKDDVMVSKSDKELLSESVTREMKSNANQDRRKKKTYTVDPQETVASNMWEKLFAQVTDQISAAEKRMTESFTRQFNILREEGDVNHTEAGLRGGVLDECFSLIPNIEIKNADLSVESIGKKQFQLTSQERKRKRKPSTKLRTPYTHPRPLYNHSNPQMNHALSLKEFVKPGPKILYVI